VLRTRLWTAAIALPAVLAVIIFAPAWLFTIFIATLGVIGLCEIGAMTDALQNFVALPILAIVGGVALFGLLRGGDAGPILPAIVILAMLGLIAQVAAHGGSAGPKGTPLTLLGAAYVGVLFPYFALLRNSTGGVGFIIFMLLLTVASDSGAYFTGRSIGRTPLIPRVSPNKTVEGAIGGLLAAIAAGLILRPLLTPGWKIGASIAVSATIAVLAQLGDLAGSALKRSAGVKDSGWIFPGHGGLVDRTCSLFFAAVFTYYWTH
jgi:phosphatidate cytidylyltransferase